jgi:hypothetical protein
MLRAALKGDAGSRSSTTLIATVQHFNPIFMVERSTQKDIALNHVTVLSI